MNMKATYEDGMVMSRSASERFVYTAEVTRTLNMSSRHIPNIGTLIMPYQTEWWQCHFEGVVTNVKRIDINRVIVVIHCDCYPVNGDKFTTWHGQKGVVTIVNDHDMPCINGQYTELVIGSSSVLKRGTINQMLEAAYTQYAIDNMEFVSTPVSLSRMINNKWR